MDILKKDGFSIVSPDSVKQTEFFPIYLEHLNGGRGTDFTARSTYPIYAYLFNMASSGTVSNYETVNFDDVIDRMIRYSSSLWNDFYEESRFLPWLRKQRMFFEYAFFSADLYIHWDAEAEEYSFYLKLGKSTYKDDEKEEDIKYLNIETNETVIFDDPEQDLIKYSWNGRNENRFRQWFKLAFQMEIREHIYNTQCLLWNKRLVIKADGYANANRTTLEAVKKDLVNLAPFLNKTDHQSIIDFIEVPIITAAEIDTFLRTSYLWLDREISEFGRVANLNPKPERKTAGENYIAIDRQIDHLRCLQDQLDLMAGDMEERGWPPLVFKVNTEQGLGMIAEPEGDQQPTQEDATKTEDAKAEETEK